jgi:hypothetical protein
MNTKTARALTVAVRALDAAVVAYVVEAKASRAKRRCKAANVCEGCASSAGARYFSDERCNRTGIGVCLCGPCSDAAHHMYDADFRAFLAR